MSNATEEKVDKIGTGLYILLGNPWHLAKKLRVQNFQLLLIEQGHPWMLWRRCLWTDYY